MEILPIKKENIIKKYGNKIILENLTCGDIMGMPVITGFSTVDQLAVISDADAFDQITNKGGTQRDLDWNRAKKALQYMFSEQEVLFFPTIILNVREDTGVRIYKNEEETTFNDISSGDYLKLEIDLDTIEFPKDHAVPEISRVDGNHRLAGTDLLFYHKNLDEDEEAVIKLDDVDSYDLDKMPTIQFLITSQLTKEEEMQIFHDINHFQKGMQTDHIRNLQMQLQPEDEIYERIELFVTKAAQALGEDEDAPFHNKMFFGGSKAGLQEKGLETITTLTMMERSVKATFNNSDELSAMFRQLNSKEKIIKNLKDVWASYINTWPNQFDTKNTVALKTIGMYALGMLAGNIFNREYQRMQDNPKRCSPEGIQIYLDAIQKKEPSFWEDAEEKYKGLAGGSAGRQVYDDLLAILQEQQEYIGARFQELA